MSFIADKQTLEDLNILGKYKPNSLFSFFNRVSSSGAEKILEAMFLDPLTDCVQINARSATFKYFHEKTLDFPFDSVQLSVMAHYLHDEVADNLPLVGIQTIKKYLHGILVKDEAYENARAGIKATISILNSCRQLMQNLGDLDLSNPCQQQIKSIDTILVNPRLHVLKRQMKDDELKTADVITFEYLFRNKMKGQLRSLIDIIYHLEIYITIGKIARSEKFTYAEMLPGDSNVTVGRNLSYPGLKSAVGNDFEFDKDTNVIFLTGANMAGKSTLMKTFGIAVYLAHMGFPVAASSMTLSLKDGIYSSINVPDNLSMGLSHFYAEVLRVKKVAQDVAGGKNLVVIFDELFKGTNVKDAYDATLAVTTAFSEYDNCQFIISTHIIEVAEALQQLQPIQFLYLPTVLEANIPRYTYRLSTGITTDRQGMTIIENEGILEMMKEEI